MISSHLKSLRLFAKELDNIAVSPSLSTKIVIDYYTSGIRSIYQIQIVSVLGLSSWHTTVSLEVTLEEPSVISSSVAYTGGLTSIVTLNVSSGIAISAPAPNLRVRELKDGLDPFLSPSVDGAKSR